MASFDETTNIEHTAANLNVPVSDVQKAVTDMQSNIDWDKKTVPAKLNKDGIKRARQMAFLENFQESGSIQEACKIAGINRQTELRWRHDDAWYQRQFADAYENFKDLIEREIRDRAIKGVQVPIIGKVQTPQGPEDVIIGHKTVKSDLLTMFLAKRHIPEYKDKYDPPKIDIKIEEVSPMARISTQLEAMTKRKKHAEVAISGKVIDVIPEETETKDDNASL